MRDGTYSLRAISSYGADGIIYYSPEKMGIIDRKSFAPFGIPSPYDGVLRQGEEISVTFDKTLNCNLSGASIKLFLEDSTEIAILPQCYGNKIILKPSMTCFYEPIITIP